jgi:hypothetical protein
MYVVACKAAFSGPAWGQRAARRPGFCRHAAAAYAGRTDRAASHVCVLFLHAACVATPQAHHGARSAAAAVFAKLCCFPDFRDGGDQTATVTVPPRRSNAVPALKGNQLPSPIAERVPRVCGPLTRAARVCGAFLSQRWDCSLAFLLLRLQRRHSRQRQCNM